MRGVCGVLLVTDDVCASWTSCAVTESRQSYITVMLVVSLAIFIDITEDARVYHQAIKKLVMIDSCVCPSPLVNRGKVVSLGKNPRPQPRITTGALVAKRPNKIRCRLLT